MNKKLLSLVLSLVMVLGTFTSVFANTEPAKKDEKAEQKVEKVEKVTGKDNKIQYIIDKKFVEGYGNGDYGYDKNIKRSEITKLLVFANGNKSLAEKLQGTMKLYKDVDTSFWANGVIAVGTTVPSDANNQAMLNGYPDGNFLPENNVTYAELSKMLVVLVKKDLTADMVKDANKHWAGQWMTWAAQLGILDDVEVKDSNAAATRADAFTMVYNALYAMKNIKAEKSEAKLGILSDLRNNELTLNQDKDQKYKVTDNTVYVKADVDRSGKDNFIKVYAIKDANYYLGSLVRVMINDKNEVTHILELGNPKDGALGKNNNKELDNHRWDGVADRTASTYMFNIKSADDKYADNSYAEFKYDRADVDTIKIVYNNQKTEKDLKTYTSPVIDVKDDTRVFIANPANNQMKEVKDIYEAMRLLGFDKAVKVPNVYVGYDTESRDSVIGTKTKATAKVIVFNVVNKDNLDEETYRVVQPATSTGTFTLEDVDGKEYDENNFRNANRFPFAKFEKWDVVKFALNVKNNERDWEYVIDHSETKEYPIVKVTDINKDKNLIVVEDENGRKALLDIDDADIFTKSVAKNDKVQFVLKADADTNEVDVLSVLPKSMDLEGSLNTAKNKVVTFAPNSAIIRVIRVDEDKLVYTEYNALLEEKSQNDKHKAFDSLTKAEQDTLKNFAGKKQLLVVEFGNDDQDSIARIYEITGKANDFGLKEVPIENKVDPKEDLKKAILKAKELGIGAEDAKLKKAISTFEDKLVSETQVKDDTKALNDEIKATEAFL